MLNILTIDLEDYFMVSAFESVVRREDWDKYESRIERNTHRLLEILSEAKPCSSEPESSNPAPCTLCQGYLLLPWLGGRTPSIEQAEVSGDV